MEVKLMGISLITDDYIYKNKAITVQDAEKYKNELVSYKRKCRDERHLQVINKLTFYMERIIEEQLPINNFEEDNNNDILDGQSIKDYEKCETNVRDDRLQNKIQEIERTFSNLSILNVEYTAGAGRNINSHSPVPMEHQFTAPYKLNNENIDKIFKEKIDTRNNVNSRNQILEPENSVATHEKGNFNRINTNSNSTNICYSNIQNNNSCLKSSENLGLVKEHISNKHENKNMPTDNDIQQFITSSTNTTANIVEKKPKRQRNNTIKKKAGTAIILNKVITKNTQKAANKRKIQFQKPDPSVTAQNITSRVECINVRTYNNSNSCNENYSLKKKPINSNLRQNMEIDMSWVEGIKFVREVDVQEYETVTNIKDSFWSNYSLPSDINSNDFEYDNINIWKS